MLGWTAAALAPGGLTGALGLAAGISYARRELREDHPAEAGAFDTDQCA